MKLTEKHERHLSRYLREVEAGLRAMPERDRVKTISRLRSDIHNDLRALTNDVPRDKDIETVLSKYGTPAAAAADLLNRGNGESTAILTPEDGRVWLGVCQWIAETVDVPAWVVRTLAVVVCCIPFLIPLVLIAYTVTWFAVVYPRDSQPPAIDWLHVAKRVASALLIGLCVYWGARGAVWFLFWAPAKLTDVGVPPIPDYWTWLTRDNGWYCFWGLAIALPLAFVSGLPVRADWEGTLVKLWQTVLALYGAVVGMGLAYLIVGMILVYTSQYTGMDLLTVLRELMGA